MTPGTSPVMLVRATLGGYELEASRAITDAELELIHTAALEVEAEWGGDPVPTVPLAAELEAIVTRIRGDQ